MPISDDKIADLNVKQLEMAQAIITRLSANSASLKNYCITIVAAIGSASVTLQKPIILAFAALVIVVFASLDAQYLKVERRYRSLFDNLRTSNWTNIPAFDISLATAPKRSFWAALTSWSVLWFYLLLAIGLGIAIFFTRSSNGCF